MKEKFSAGKLSVKYVILHRIGSANWVLTNHTSTISVGLGKFIYTVGVKVPFDYGSYIFDQTMTRVDTCATKLPIAFHTLIGEIILHQHPGILSTLDTACKRATPLSQRLSMLKRPLLVRVI